MKPAGMAVICLLWACTGTVTDRGDDDDDMVVTADADPAAPDADPAAPDADPAAPDADPAAPDARPPSIPDARPPSIPDARLPSIPDARPDFGMLSPKEQELFETINAERVARGLGTVELRTDLNCAAARHSLDIGTTRTCSHTGSDGSSPTTRVQGCGGSGWSGEIVACGQTTPRSAVDAWIGSPGHNEIMFTPSQRYIGVAMHNNFWTAIFDR